MKGEAYTKLYTVWSKRELTSINEKCLLDSNGNFIGQTSGNKYSKDEYYCSKLIDAQIVNVDSENNTGMYHLWKGTGIYNEDNRKSWKEKYLGCYVTVEEAHWYGDHKIYRCLELNEYFSDNELLILDERKV